MQQNISLLGAFAGGIISFLSPCVLPLVPIYLSYMLGADSETRARKVLLLRAAGFIVGFSLVFILLGASASLLGKILTANKNLLREISGVAMIFFGLNMVGVLKLDFLHKEKRINYSPKNSSSLGSSFMLGIVFAAGWTPCIGPILASILVYAGSVETVNQGIALLVAYSLGLALPFFLAALLAGSVSSKIKNINRYLPYITKASGVLMVILGYLVFNNKLAWLNSYFNFFGS